MDISSPLDSRSKRPKLDRNNMKNLDPLHELNFKKLLNYPDGPKFTFESDSKVKCAGFCVSCEKNGFIADPGFPLDQMSHGADTQDFEQILGPLNSEKKAPKTMFLLESPGGDYGNGKPIEHEGITKRPPIKHYYWLPQQGPWPTEPNGGKYGPYFAYLIQAHGFYNAYFTNIVKCSMRNESTGNFDPLKISKKDSNHHFKILKNCYDEFLSEEILLFDPDIIFNFGQRTGDMAGWIHLESKYPDVTFDYLYHPSAHMSWDKIVEANDVKIRTVIAKACSQSSEGS